MKLTLHYPKMGSVDGRITVDLRPLDEQAAEERDKYKAMAIIIMSMKDSVIHHIVECTDSANAWKFLHTMYKGRIMAHTMQLLNTLYTLWMQEGTIVKELIWRMGETSLQLKTAREKI